MVNRKGTAIVTVRWAGRPTPPEFDAQGVQPQGARSDKSRSRASQLRVGGRTSRSAGSTNWPVRRPAGSASSPVRRPAGSASRSKLDFRFRGRASRLGSAGSPGPTSTQNPSQSGRAPTSRATTRSKTPTREPASRPAAVGGRKALPRSSNSVDPEILTTGSKPTTTLFDGITKDRMPTNETQFDRTRIDPKSRTTITRGPSQSRCRDRPDAKRAG